MNKFYLTENSVVDVTSLCRQNAEIKISVAQQQFKRISDITCGDEGLINVHLSFTKDNFDNVLLTKLSADLMFNCQRCLKSVKLNLTSKTDYLLVKSTPFKERSNFEVIVVENGNLHLHNLLEDELLLAVPHIVKHDNCDAPEFNNHLYEVLPNNQTNPFAVLAQLKN